MAAVAPASAAAIKPSGKGKKASLQTTLPLSDEFGFAGFPHSDAAGVYPAHLPGADPERAVRANYKRSRSI